MTGLWQINRKLKFSVYIKLNILIFMLAVSAGFIFFTCAFTHGLPANVTVNGVSVGGKSRAEAVEILRKSFADGLKEKTLKIHGEKNEYEFAYPEINFKDDLQSLLKSVKRGGEYFADVKYYLNGISEICSYVCADESESPAPPQAIFKTEGEPFEYADGKDGRIADGAKLLSDIRLSLAGNFEDVYVSVKPVKFTGSMEKIKRETRLLSSFTTYFDGANAARAHNIRLAARLINGTVLPAGGGFSFNGTVGSRTAARGFKTAKIIEKGEFVEGIGGGVCQVSTTLYNAALLAGCEITEFHPHSLAVGYVPPSFDAMVSGTYCDLKFTNPTRGTLYFRAYTGEDYIRFSVYGEGDGAEYDFISRVTGSIDAPEEVTDDEAMVKEGKEGILSEGYLIITRNGIKKNVLFRKDRYAPVKRVVLNSETNGRATDG